MDKSDSNREVTESDSVEVLFCNSKSVELFGKDLKEAPSDNIGGCCQIEFRKIYNERVGAIQSSKPENRDRTLSIIELIKKQQSN